MQHVNLRALRRGFSSRFAFDPAAHHARRNNQTTLNRATRDAGLPLTGTLATVGNALGGSPPHPKGIRGAVALPVYSLRRSCSPQRHVHIVRKPPPESQLAGGGSGRGGEVVPPEHKPDESPRGQDFFLNFRLLRAKTHFAVRIGDPHRLFA